MFLNFRIPQATFYEMDSKYSRLQNYAIQSNPDHTNDKDENERSWPRSIFQSNIDRLQKYFQKHSNSINDRTSSSTDDIQGLLQKGDNDPILPALV
ncbi:hypothetical protein I4U23_000690 [Adineta vaga]|nr:hypothetical protein I4U23_000690 [Adineta vaga]